MRILIYGGSFNPPHNGHVEALRSAAEAMEPDRLLVIPAGMPPHKELAGGSPPPMERLALSELAFRAVKKAEVSDLELSRDGKSYTVETLRTIKGDNPGDELFLLVGTDMLLSIDTWYEFREILSLCTLVALARNDGDQSVLEKKAEQLRGDYGAGVILIRKKPLPMDSTSLRAAFPLRQGRDRVDPAVYAEIIRNRYYGAKPELEWLRRQAYAMLKPSRVAHVQGCEQEAVRLAERWDADPGEAAEAAILHDVTKKYTAAEQLAFCEERQIPVDEAERADPKLLHAVTGARIARDRFGVSQAVSDAIARHTTGCAHMTTLDKIIYLADFTEPTRRFDGVEEVRALTFVDLDAAMIRALQLSLQEVLSRNGTVHPRSRQALEWLESMKKEGQ